MTQERVCAGSLLGIALHQGTSFPVGKVDFLKLYPLSFKEFLTATDKERFAELLDKRDFPLAEGIEKTYAVLKETEKRKYLPTAFFKAKKLIA